MPKKHLKLAGATQVERHLLTARIVDAIEGAGGTILDAQLHATVAATIRFEFPCAAASGLCQAFHLAGLALDAASGATLAAVPADGEPVAATASIRFEAAP